MPVYIGVRSRSGSNSGKHPFSRVLALGTRRGTVPDKVVDKYLRAFPNLPKVDRLSAFGEEEKSIEIFKQNRGGLVDRAQDCLTGGCKFTKELKNVPGCLRVETGCGLIEEEQQSRLGDQFYPNGETLSLLDIQTCYQLRL